jgi:hypothetical protein
LIHLKKITLEQAEGMGVSKGTAKFAAKVAKVVEKSNGKLNPREVQKLVKTKGVKGAEEEAEEIVKTGKTGKQVIQQAVKEKKTKMTAQQVVAKPMQMFEEAYDEYPQYQAEFKKILKSFLDNI